MTVRPTHKKIENTINKIEDMLTKNWVKIRGVASVLGILNDLCKGVEYGGNYVKNLERDKIAALRVAGKSQFEGFMHMSDKSINDLHWWKHNLPTAHKQICNTAPNMTLTTDASLSGWGAVWEVSTGGVWSKTEKQAHINELELHAVFLGLQTLFKNTTNSAIRVLTDNTITVACINHMGGTKSLPCDKMAHDIWQWCEKRKIWLYGAHIPGALNVQADHKSTRYSENTEWTLNEHIFTKIVENGESLK